MDLSNQGVCNGGGPAFESLGRRLFEVKEVEGCSLPQNIKKLQMAHTEA